MAMATRRRAMAATEWRGSAAQPTVTSDHDDVRDDDGRRCDDASEATATLAESGAEQQRRQRASDRRTALSARRAEKAASSGLQAGTAQGSARGGKG